MMQKMVMESGGKGLLVLVNGVAINNLSKTFKSLRNSLRDIKEFEVTITPVLEGG